MKNKNNIVAGSLVTGLLYQLKKIRMLTKL